MRIIKEYGLAPMHTKMRSFEANWNAAIDLQVPMVECTRPGLPCSLHPLLCPVKKKEKGE